MILTPAQNQIASDLHRFRVLNCGRRFGKTSLAIEEIKGKAVARESRIAYIAPTIQQARDIAWEQLKKEMRPIISSTNESRLEMRVKTVDGEESLIVLRGWEAVETLRGQFFDFLVIDEVATMRNFWSGWNEVLSPTLTDRAGDALFISTPKGFNHFYDLYNNQDKDETYKSFHYTTFDNPHIPVEEIERERRSKPEDSFAQEYLAEFRKMEGLVYKEFSRERHLFDDFTPYKVATRLVGIDFGFTNPSAILTIEKDHDSTYWVRFEWYKRGKTEEQIAEYAQSIKANAYYPDPENPAAIKRLEDLHLNIREVIKGQGSVASGINKVRELFKQNRLRVHKDCVNLINELETYRYPEPKEGQNDGENPVKENDHALDALRYVIMMDYGISEEEVEQDFSLYSATYN
jgi:PBSX family phage terminase large subunit